MTMVLHFTCQSAHLREEDGVELAARYEPVEYEQNF